MALGVMEWLVGMGSGESSWKFDIVFGVWPNDVGMLRNDVSSSPSYFLVVDQGPYEPMTIRQGHGRPCFWRS